MQYEKESAGGATSGTDVPLGAQSAGIAQLLETIVIRTPEGVELEYTLAGLGSRFAAQLLDLLVRIVVIAAIIGILAAINQGVRFTSTATTILLILTIFVAVFVYDVVFEVWGGGRTPGKRWCGLRVVMKTGQTVTFAPSAVRNLLRIVDEWATAFLPGVVTMFASRSNQRLGDLAAGTIVVRERSSAPPEPSFVSTVSPATEVDVTAVSAAELSTVWEFLTRREGLSPESRARVASALASKLEPKVGGLAPGGLPPEQLLETIAVAKSSARYGSARS